MNLNGRLNVGSIGMLKNYTKYLHERTDMERGSNDVQVRTDTKNYEERNNNVLI